MTPYEQVVESLPSHLRQYVVEQDYSRYTSMDQATWRFVLRQLKSYLSKAAHPCYVEGLEKTGISIEEIPHIDVMCEKLQQFGWMAVPVSGFIPPAAFMELQSLNILPIASDMRSMDHILYTPAPDIVHEAAGHAPILIDQQFANYLKEYASVAKKAILSREDLAQYEAIRDLSDIKESSSSTPEAIAQAEKNLVEVNNSISFVSEAALLGRMNWWTAEYGMVGPLDNPKIFGAGLLSSLGESRATPQVKKIPLTVDCIETSYDITEQQPQLFVTPDFQHLTTVLHHLEEKMSFKRGGVHGLKTAKQAQTVNTVELDSGVQISGRLAEYTSRGEDVDFFKMEGPVQICFAGQQLQGQGPERHPEGFSSPIGLSEEELKQLQLGLGEVAQIEWPSGIHLKGRVQDFVYADHKLVIITFNDCTITHGANTLYRPEWGSFDMVVGTRIASVFSGPADRKAFGIIDTFVKKVIPRRQWTSAELQLQKIYELIRQTRKSNGSNEEKAATLNLVAEQLDQNFPEEWLAYLEILELLHTLKVENSLRKSVYDQLMKIREKNTLKKEYIDLGLELVDKVV
ncbi:MAG: aromatic amino acid hydroxylase [Bdellovibrionales bacterium]|nr:aromatic amino acid hydroxylase [Bdellovibrionales bacterium]